MIKKNSKMEKNSPPIKQNKFLKFFLRTKFNKIIINERKIIYILGVCINKNANKNIIGKINHK